MMKSKEDLRAEYEGNSRSNEPEAELSDQEMVSFFRKISEGYYTDSESEISSFTHDGFAMGVVYSYGALGKGELPDYIKNIRVLAVKSFENTMLKFPDYTAPQEFYIGYINGYCYGYEIYCNSL